MKEVLRHGEPHYVDNLESRYKDLDWAIGLNRLTLRVMGTWPADEENSRLKNLAAFPIISMMISLICFMFIPQMYALMLVNNDLVLVCDNLMTSSPSFTCCIKLFILWRSTNVLRPVVNTVIEDWLRSKKEWEFEIMRKEATMAKLFTIGGYVFLVLAYACFIFAPLCGLNIRIINNITDPGRRHLLFQSFYPYDYSSSPIFEITHISQLIGGCCVVMAMAVPDNYLGILVYHLSAQFKILGITIEHFIRENDKVFRRGKTKYFQKKLGLYVDRHEHLIRMVTAIEKAFNLLVLTQLFCMYVMVCSLAFRLLYSLKRTDEKLPILQILNLILALISVAMFTLTECAASESLASHSDALFYHIYNCKWYMVPEQNIQDLIILMVMSKKPKMLSAGKIVPLSMSSYCTILKSIAGYLSVLVTISN